MTASSSAHTRLFTLIISSALALLVAGAVLRYALKEGPTVKIEDHSRDVAAILEARRGELDPDELAALEATDGTWPRALIREPLDPEVAAKFFPALSNGAVYDPHVFVRRRSNIDHRMKFAEHPDGGWRVKTNSEGLRENEDILEEQPDVRILVAGDSHTDGLCPNEESFANVLEAMLAEERPGEVVEVLNTGTGAYHFYNYLGVLERFRDLSPDVYVIAVYGGNDFYKNLGLLRYFERLPAPVMGPIRLKKLVQSSESGKGAVPQELGQVVHFLNNPDDVALAIDNACSLTREIHRLAEELGTELIFVYLPPPFVGQPQFFEEELVRTTDLLGIEPEQVKISDDVADPWLEYCSEQGIPCIDLRPIFQEAEEVKYWYTDHHLNIPGHRDIAELVKPLVDEVLGS